MFTLNFYRLWIKMVWARILYTWGSFHRYFGNQQKYKRDHHWAVRSFTRAYEVDPTFKEALLSRGILFWRELGMPEKALEDFNQLLEEDEDFAPARLNRAQVYESIGEYQAALNDLEYYLTLPQEEIEGYIDVVQRTSSYLRDILGGIKKPIVQ